jgi:ankyrin repeat protein
MKAKGKGKKPGWVRAIESGDAAKLSTLKFDESPEQALEVALVEPKCGEEILLVLMEKGLNPKDVALASSAIAQAKNPELVALFIDNGYGWVDGVSPLGAALRANNVGVAKVLIDRGADVDDGRGAGSDDSADSDNSSEEDRGRGEALSWTPLGPAVDGGHEEMVSLLLEKKGASMELTCLRVNLPRRELWTDCKKRQRGLC